MSILETILLQMLEQFGPEFLAAFLAKLQGKKAPPATPAPPAA